MGQLRDAGPLRFALVGAGNIAAAHANALAQRPHVGSVVAVCDPRQASRTALLQSLPEAKGFESLEDLLDGIEVDAAIVCTPHDVHAQQSIMLTRRGIPALVEKPVTCTTAELREVHAESSRTGAFVMPGQTRRFAPEVRWARAHLVANPSLFGRLTTFAIESLQNARLFGGGHWLTDGKAAGGGVVISLAVHELDLVRFLSGVDYELVAAFAQYAPPFINGAESSMTATLRMTNGAIGSMHASYVATRAPFAEGLMMLGEHGALAQHAEKLGDYIGPLRMASTASIDPAPATGQAGGWVRIPPAPGLEHLASGGKDEEAAWGDMFGNEQEHFADVVRGRAKPIVTLQDNFNTIACIEALMYSARDECPVRVETW